MRKIMQELDRIYFQPLFRKRCRFLLKNNQFTGKKHKRKFNKIVDNLGSKQDLLEECKTLRYVGNNSNFRNIKSSTSIETLKAFERENTVLKAKHVYKKHLKGVQNLVLKKPKVKLSRKLRLWLIKRQIFILKRKLVNKTQNLITKSKVNINPKIWR